MPICPCFRGAAVEWCCRQCHRKSRYTGNKYGVSPKAEVTLCQQSRQLETKLQCLRPYFRDLAVQRCRQLVGDVTEIALYRKLTWRPLKTKSNTISAHRTTKNKIPTPASIFSISLGSTTLSATQPEVKL